MNTMKTKLKASLIEVNFSLTKITSLQEMVVQMGWE